MGERRVLMPDLKSKLYEIYENPYRVSKSVWKVDALSNDEPRGKRLQNWKDKSKANRKTIQISE
jgi:hypothetical protein